MTLYDQFLRERQILWHSLKRPLHIGPEQEDRIRRIKEYAARHPFTRPEIQRIIYNPAKYGRRIGDNAPSTIVLPMGYGVGFSIEHQPMGWCCHLSISLLQIDHPPEFPEYPAVQLIAAAYGLFTPPIVVWPEGWTANLLYPRPRQTTKLDKRRRKRDIKVRRLLIGN